MFGRNGFRLTGRRGTGVRARPDEQRGQDNRDGDQYNRQHRPPGPQQAETVSNGAR